MCRGPIGKCHDFLNERLRTPLGTAILCALAALVVLAITTPGLAMVWDENEYLWRSEQVKEWLQRVVQSSLGGRERPFRPAEIEKYWPFVTYVEGHPAFGAVMMAVSRWLAPAAMHPLTAARMGTVAVYSLALGAVAYRMRQRYGIVAALTSVCALLTYPRLFAEAHYAALDAQLTAWWLMVWACEGRARHTWRGELWTSLGSGLLLGLAAATKFTGWLAAVPLALARLVPVGGRARAGGLLIAGVASLLAFYAVDPPLWYHPIAAFRTHLQLNLHRELNVPVTFLGTTYGLQQTLPWYNTLVWLLLVTPVHLLLLGGVGVAQAWRRRQNGDADLVWHWAVLMVVRALPGMPPHDGIRLFLPAFAFWCLLAGVGAQAAWTIARRLTTSRQALAGGALAASLAAGGIVTARYYPQDLSHYNLLAGGARGAAALGMEPTYWWDGLDRAALEWLNAHTGAGERIAFSSIAHVNLLRSWGWLHPEQVARSDRFRWYVFQNRTSFLADSDRWLMTHEAPAFARYPGGHAAADVPFDLRVPILLVYSFDQYQRARAAVGGG